MSGSRVLLATIRNLGGCPCPRCELTKDQISQVGTIPDDNRRTRLKRTNGTRLSWNIRVARDAIYQYGKTIKSKVVEDILFPLSYVPTSVNSPQSIRLYLLLVLTVTKNAFSDRFGESFDFFSLLVVDLMHEFELGVWKALFIHLIRILVAQGGTAIQEFNSR